VTDLWLGGALLEGGAVVWTAPTALVVGAGVVAAVAWLLALRGARPAWARVVESLAWGLALAGIVVAIARPMWVAQAGREVPGRVALLIDASCSMSLREDDIARSVAAQALGHRLRADDVEVFHFGDRLEPGDAGGNTLPGTDVGVALRALADRIAGTRLAGVAIVSDGVDRGDLRASWRAGEALQIPPELGPISTYAVGTQAGARDLSVQDIDAGGFAFARQPFTLRAHLRGVGYEGKAVPVTLSRDGGVVTQRTVTLDSQGQADVAFETTIDSGGRFQYEIAVPTFAGDAVEANNRASVVVRSVVDRVRVLQVSGTPSWDVKFLRRFLKEDPSVDLVSFFILRTPGDLRAGFGERELSLIQFPYEDLFGEQLSTFDVVIFQNFDWEPYFHRGGEGLLQNVADYVQGGGAFVMVGGDRSFDLGAYGGTPIEEILPVKLGLPKETSVAFEPFQPTLTAAGRRHPITRLVQDEAENQAWWTRLHKQDGSHRVAGLAPGAAALLVREDVRLEDGSPMPVLAVREVGKGRTMALTIDGSWRWSFSEAAEGRGNQAYLRFWKNAARWLMADSSLARVTAETSRENYRAGEPVRVIVTARTPGFAPLAGATVTLTLPGASLEPMQTGSDGQAIFELDTLASGGYRATAAVSDAQGLLGRADTLFAVTERDPELDEVAPDPGFLAALAAATGGRAVAVGDFAPPTRDPGAVRVVSDWHETPLWRAPALAFWVALWAGIAWTVRRRSGLR